MAKLESDYIVYATDTDGSERKAGTFTAKSEGHARAMAQQQGVRKITDIVAATGVKTVKELMDELRRERRDQPPIEIQADADAYDRQFI